MLASPARHPAWACAKYNVQDPEKTAATLTHAGPCPTFSRRSQIQMLAVNNKGRVANSQSTSMSS
eukprot:CAMPEP_0177406300 /NCGR_PEP_ID=MMETSP0368-20130122/62490_1 /TAXON_ID=447022 ORGANISM="Scrippsiella hangoei-like, Strain SHHI-4" /NCGR_SAMPLE_ID=MMETSP0368 /ASSEMBLY_ACC=CAM_ASM_000363 /LENGTH=64 /DNA_ID=CAMNT_0018874699 /DNA_START=9 /DNA_END=200 /DNA_ORIENTATION=-